MDFLEVIKLSDREVEDMVDTGKFNTIIQGYCIMAMTKAGFSDKEIERLDFVDLFDTISAWEARRASNDE